MKIKILKLSFALALVMQACGDEHAFLPQIEKASDNTAKIKFIHAASDTAKVNLFIDDKKITSNAPSAITTVGSVNLGKVNIGAITFPTAFPVTNYTAVDRISGTFSVVFPESYNATATFPAKTHLTASVPSLEPSSYYTVAFVGVSKSYEIIVYKDDLSTAPIDGKAYIRFANFIHNSADNVTLRGTPPATTEDPNPVPVILVSNVSYKGMSAFMALPRPGTYTNVQILNASTGAVMATLEATNSTFANNKVFTIFARGRIGGAGAAAPGVTRIINR